MKNEMYNSIGLFSADPWSFRVEHLRKAYENLGIDVTRVISWKVAREGAVDFHKITIDDKDLSKLDAIIVMDLGANDIGAFFNRVGLLSALAEMGVEVINPVSSILLMRNKSETLRKLVSKRLPVPRTLITESIEDAAKFISKNAPCVLKPITGFGGEGVQLIERDFDLEHVYDYLKFHSQIFGKGAYLLQDLVKNPGFDIRVLVVDGEVIASMQRHGDGALVTNIHSGGIPKKNDIDVSNIAIAAAESVKARVAGVDIIPDLDGNYWILEVNATPGWRGLQKVTEYDITEKIVEHLSHSR